MSPRTFIKRMPRMFNPRYLFFILNGVLPTIWPLTPQNVWGGMGSQLRRRGRA
jgi:hypothetical protein